MKVSDQQFFSNQGSVGICRVFREEIKTNGKIGLRGEPTIDSFIELVNGLIDTKNKETNE